MSDEINLIDLVKEQCRDGHKWAKSFIQMYGSDLRKIDEDVMIGWFCNSMMSMHDSLYNNEIQKLEQVVAVLQEANDHYANRMDDGGTAREAKKKVEEILK